MVEVAESSLALLVWEKGLPNSEVWAKLDGWREVWCFEPSFSVLGLLVWR
jgi:hypothetical protein